MTETYYTADEHYFHDAIIEHCNRPFKNGREMNQRQIEYHNEIVKENDTVHHVGDFIPFVKHMEKIASIVTKLNGNHHLILGNHETANPFTYVDAGFQSVHTALWFPVKEYTFVLAHDPSVYCTLKPNMILICGHIHTLFDTIKDKLTVNVGVDVRNYKPVSEQAILSLIE